MAQLSSSVTDYFSAATNTDNWFTTWITIVIGRSAIQDVGAANTVQHIIADSALKQSVIDQLRVSAEQGSHVTLHCCTLSKSQWIQAAARSLCNVMHVENTNLWTQMVNSVYNERLVAILFADVVGYSRLTGENEIRTDRIVNKYFQLINEAAVSHNGRVVQFAGDSLLSEFTTATNAVTCALDVLQQIAYENEKRPESERIRFRIGINLGEVNSDGNRIFGDSVNIAARLEGLAEPGGICVSESVRAAVGNKILIDYEFLGEQYVKNIRQPIRPYRVCRPTNAKRKLKISAISIKLILKSVVAAGIVSGIVIGGALFYWPSDHTNILGSAQPVTKDQPSIAVLPFANLSSDIEQEHFIDGLTNDIITDLSKFSGLFVIAANSTFRYKDKPTKIQDIAKELNVRYVLEGSVQRMQDNLRINAQLIEGDTGYHVWAEKYDRKPDDFFIIQNDIGQKIVAVIGPISGGQGKLRRSELERLAQTPTKNLSAYEQYIKGVIHYEQFDVNENKLAREQFNLAIDLDPNYAQALARLAWTYLQDSWNEWSDDPEESLNQAKVVAQQAIKVDPSEAMAHESYGSVLLFLRQHDAAIRSLRKALELNPNDANIMMHLGWILTYSGQAEEGLEVMNEALLRNPFYPGWYYWDLAWGYFVSKDYEAAIRTLEKRDPKSTYTHLLLAVNYKKAGREKDAVESTATFRKLEPGFTVSVAARQEPFKHPADLNHYLDALRNIGLPDE